MRITDKFRPNRPLLSIEIFPPKTDKGTATLKERLRDYARFQPDFVSVTYGAGGGTRGGTTELAGMIQRELGVTAMAHLTCGGHSVAEIDAILRGFQDAGVEHVMALRGDPPQGQTAFTAHADGFRYAADLIRHSAARYPFTLGCAAYPESHIESPSLDRDMDHLKAKLDAGARFMVTQFFLDNIYFFRFRDLLRERGITAPLIAGILPIVNYSQITRFSLMCGCTIPAKVMKGLHGRSDADQEKFGLEHAAEQVEELLREGIDGIHVYALNKQEAVETLAPLVRARAPA